MIRDRGSQCSGAATAKLPAHFHIGTRGTTQQPDINVTAEGFQAPVKTPPKLDRYGFSSGTESTTGLGKYAVTYIT
jgi:hypothetical protein